eukprot:m.723456 g.723456  ORF g.723456 m.723456 type:complete len:284 (+) comp23022_c0_seq5:67-918(+)
MGNNTDATGKTPKKSKKEARQALLTNISTPSKTPKDMVITPKKSKRQVKKEQLNDATPVDKRARETPKSKKSGKKKQQVRSVPAIPALPHSPSSKDMPFAIFAGGARHTTSALLGAGGPASKSRSSSTKSKQQNTTELEAKNTPAVTEEASPEKNLPIDITTLTPVFTGVISELEAKIKGMTTQIKAVRQKLLAREDFGTGQGVSLLEAKIHLMMDYVASLGALFCLKLEGNSIEDHPVVDHLAYLYCEWPRGIRFANSCLILSYSKNCFLSHGFETSHQLFF